MSQVSHERIGISSRLPFAWWRDLPSALRLYTLLALVLDILAVASLPYYHRVYKNAARVGLWSLQADRFGDFWHYHRLFRLFHTQAFFTAADRFAYPAPCAVLMDFLYHTGPWPHLVFSLILLAALLASAFFFYRMAIQFGMKQSSAAILSCFLVLTSYPWEKLFDRSNIELFVYLFLAFGLWAYLAGRRSLAAVLWGCAGAMKIYPLVMLAIFFRGKSLRPLLIGFLTFATVLLLSFWFVGPTIAIAARGSVAGITGFLSTYAAAARIRELNIDHSFLGAVKEILLLDRHHVGLEWPHLSTFYQLFVLLAGPVLFFGWIRKLPVWNQLSLFLIAIVLLPPVSYDYTLIHIYLVFGIVVAAYLTALRRGKSFPGTTLFFIAFALLTSTQGEIQHFGLRFNGIIKCAALLLLSGLLLRFPLTVQTGNSVQTEDSIESGKLTV